MSAPIPQTLTELLLVRADAHPDRTAFSFLGDDDRVSASLTYASLDLRARAIGAFLDDHGVRGEPILLLYPPGLDLVAALFGCVYAGAIAVPACVPSSRTLPRLLAIFKRSGAKRVLAPIRTQDSASRVLSKVADRPALQWLNADEIDAQTCGDAYPAVPAAHAIAVLQYTSGTQNDPKGIALSHRNLLHNIAAIHDRFAHNEESVGVNWLPPYHDMGLVGTILAPVYGAFPSVLMTPHKFLRQPRTWLDAISRYHGTTCGGPNFGYDQCTRTLADADLEGIDLSSWKIAFIGAEPIRHETLQRFADRFLRCGFRASSFCPCYGLAESTLYVTGTAAGVGYRTFCADRDELRRGRAKPTKPDAPNARMLVGCGKPCEDAQMLVVNARTKKPCPARTVGEIWLAGASVSNGYWNQRNTNRETFSGYLSDGRGPFLRTGDLGFMEHDELFVTGRSEDLIIVQGIKHYPHDIESTVARSHPSLSGKCGVAFSLDDDSEQRFVIVHEVVRQSSGYDIVLVKALRMVCAEHGVSPAGIYLVRNGSLPRTTSGKIRRRASRDAFNSGTLAVIAYWGKPVTCTPSYDKQPNATRSTGTGAFRSPPDMLSWALLCDQRPHIERNVLRDVWEHVFVPTCDACDRLTSRVRAIEPTSVIARLFLEDLWSVNCLNVLMIAQPISSSAQVAADAIFTVATLFAQHQSTHLALAFREFTGCSDARMLNIRQWLYHRYRRLYLKVGARLGTRWLCHVILWLDIQQHAMRCLLHLGSAILPARIAPVPRSYSLQILLFNYYHWRAVPYYLAYYRALHLDRSYAARLSWHGNDSIIMSWYVLGTALGLPVSADAERNSPEHDPLVTLDRSRSGSKALIGFIYLRAKATFSIARAKVELRLRALFSTPRRSMRTGIEPDRADAKSHRRSHGQRAIDIEEHR